MLPNLVSTKPELNFGNRPGIPRDGNRIFTEDLQKALEWTVRYVQELLAFFNTDNNNINASQVNDNSDKT